MRVRAPSRTSLSGPAALVTIVPVVLLLQIRKRRKSKTLGRPDYVPQATGTRIEGVNATDAGPPGTWKEPAQGKELMLTDAAPLDTVFFEIELPVTVEQLWGALMTASPFMESFCRLRKYHDIQASHWRHIDGELCKDQQYWLPLKKNPFAPAEAYAIEHFVCQHRSGAGFIVTAHSKTPNVPCGETFHCELQWVARRLAAQRTQLRISASVVFDSHCWLRGTVNSKSKEGMKESFELLRQHLTQHVATIRGSTAARPPSLSRPAASQAPRKQLAKQLLGGLLLLLIAAVWLRFAGIMLQDWVPRGAWYDEYVTLVKRGHLRMASLELQARNAVAYYTAGTQALLQCAWQCASSQASPAQQGQLSTAALNGMSPAHLGLEDSAKLLQSASLQDKAHPGLLSA